MRDRNNGKFDVRTVYAVSKGPSLNAPAKVHEVSSQTNHFWHDHPN